MSEMVRAVVLIAFMMGVRNQWRDGRGGYAFWNGKRVVYRLRALKP